MDFLDTVIAGYPLKTLLIYAGVAVAVVWGLSKLKALLTPKKQAAHIKHLRCDNCGWNGQRSEFNRKCPRCNGRLKLAETS